MSIFRAARPADAPTPPPTGRQPLNGWWIPLLLAAVIFGSLVYDNRQYFFETKIYENSDWASNSLFVREAKSGFLLHGHYSRWAFYHPGPALLDTLAVGEAVFYDALHLVPTPYNGQILSLCLALTLFFSYALSIFARRLGGDRGGFLFFLPLAIFLALWHYGAAGGAAVFLDSWPANPPILVFLCFLVAAASTASGGGRELPVLVVAGGWLVHNYVAQPLFVVPLTLLAYLGLMVACHRLPRGEAAGARGVGGVLSAAWRTFPRAHRVAAALLALFLLPLALDALHGSDSNLSRILVHMRTHHEPGKKFLRSLCYFLTFGTYASYQPGNREFGRYSAAGMLAFAGLHWRAYALWIAVLLGVPASFLAARRRRQREALPTVWQDRGGFIPWFFVFLAAAFGLTLVWGIKQDGAMLYFNAYFNYSIYFGAALCLAAGASLMLMAWTASPGARKWRLVLSLLLWLSVAGAAVYQAKIFRVGDAGATPEDAMMERTIERAMGTLPKGGICYLDCHPWDSWPITVAVALEIERLGYKVRVNDNWEIMFGDQRTIRHEKLDASTPLVRWEVVPQSEDPARLSQWPLLSAYALDMKPLPSIDPAGQLVSFAKDGNSNQYAFFGWSPSDSFWTWSDQRTALLAFHPLPLPAGATGGVDLVVSAWSSPPPGKTDLQRMVIAFNGVTIDTVHLPLYRPDVPPLHVRISAALWQEAVARDQARMNFTFPDARSPASLGIGTDARLLGGGFRSIEFRAAHDNDAARPASETRLP